MLLLCVGLSYKIQKKYTKICGYKENTHFVLKNSIT